MVRVEISNSFHKKILVVTVYGEDLAGISNLRKAVIGKMVREDLKRLKVLLKKYFLNKKKKKKIYIFDEDDFVSKETENHYRHSRWFYIVYARGREDFIQSEIKRAIKSMYGKHAWKKVYIKKGLDPDF